MLTDEEMAGFDFTTITMKAPKAMAGMHFRIEASVLDCLGCGNCADVCPGNPKTGKALTMVPFNPDAKEMKQEIEKMMAILRMLDMQLTVRKENTTFFLDLSKVLYIEAVERNTFVYTDEGVYESEMKLYELQIMVSRMYADELRKRLGVK